MDGDGIQKLYHKHDNTVIIGDFNAHTGSIQEIQVGDGTIPPRITEPNKHADSRGYILHDLLDNTAAVMTNGRRDGSNHQPSQLCNTHVYNGTIKTDHALTYVAIKEMRRPAVRRRQRP
jgi:hypothetical protein